MKKEYQWQDLGNYILSQKTGRKRDVALRLLKGETVDLGEYGAAPEKKLYTKRRPSAFRWECKRLLAGHEGVKIDGNLVSIPELQPRKSFLKNV